MENKTEEILQRIKQNVTIKGIEEGEDNKIRGFAQLI